MRDKIYGGSGLRLPHLAAAALLREDRGGGTGRGEAGPPQ